MTDMAEPRNAPRQGFERFPQSTRVLEDLREIVRLSLDFQRHLGRVLTVGATDLAAMELLIENGPLSPSELARRLGVSTAAATQIVDRLTVLGHVDRQPHPEDRRKVVVIPQPESIGRTAGELLPVVRGVAELAATFPPDDLAVVERFLAGVAGIYRDALAAGAERTASSS